LPSLTAEDLKGTDQIAEHHRQLPALGCGGRSFVGWGGSSAPSAPMASSNRLRCPTKATPRSHVGDIVDQALSDPEESLMRFYRYLGARFEESANRAGVFDTARRIEGAQRLQTISWDEARRAGLSSARRKSSPITS
jgi:hypothetical protein